MDVFTTSAHVLDDGVIDPRDTREILASFSPLAARQGRAGRNRTVFGGPTLRHGAHMTISSFNKILIANRGEIALRVMRTARRLGYRTVAVFPMRIATRVTSVKRTSPYTSRIVAFRVISEYFSYVEAARSVGADAVHPGYGFLAENEDFAAACTRAGLVFIGPSAEAIEAMGNKRLPSESCCSPVSPAYQDTKGMRRKTPRWPKPRTTSVFRYD